MEEKMLKKCIEWLGDDVDRDCITPVYKFDDQYTSERIYLAAWNDDDGYTQVYVIRVFAIMFGNYNTVNLSQDYYNCVKVEDFVEIIPDIVNVINSVK